MSQKKGWTREKIARIVAGVGAAVLGIIAITTVAITVSQYGLGSGRSLAVAIITVSLSVFTGSLLMFGAIRYEQMSKFLDKGEIRSSIAMALTVTYLTLLPLSLVPGIGLDFGGEFLKNFHLIYIAVIGFYFGSRVLEELETLRVKGKTEP